ncbi:MAG: coenzyme F420-0:L-glutamate ligase, partial [Luminiphilus sp.]
MSSGPLQLTALQDFPLISAGDDLAEMIVHAMQQQGLTPDASGVLVVAQKIISKSEGRLVNLADVRVTEEAASLAADAQKDPRLVTLILQESRAVIRIRPGLVIAEHRTGHILANAGIDASNVGVSGDHVLLWPEDPDESARQLSARIAHLTGVHMPIVINDSLGRPWRMGTVGFAI